ncbi:MAG: hypothetical protein CME99_13675 [Hyphomonas sp.]|uniref:hypothetical protein n=1 Tax=Hyphomonas TaxID=85 RepID=UPI000B75BC30|nr:MULTISPECIES: hypothetical protein [Hyphomonas]MAH94209.1 hypothetical protein [Hyphomonas sp.]OUX83140.1 MAG: hypothetical protein CBB91_13355 [Hyphomonas sp. TMED31]
MGRTLTAILAFICVAFLIVLGWFYYQEGSFEGAGARMDATIDDLPEETSEFANEVSEAADEISDELDQDGSPER